MRLIIRKDAEADIAEGFDWYETQQEGLGDAFLTELATTLSMVQTEPKRFPVIFKQLRRALVARFPYGLYFFATPDCVVIVAVLHLARNPERWRARH